MPENNLRIRVLSPSFSSPAAVITDSGTSTAVNGSVDLPASLLVLSPLASPTGKPLYRVQPYVTVAHLKRAIVARVDEMHARALVPSSPDSVSLVFSGRVLADDELLGQAFAKFLPDIADFSTSDVHPDDPIVLTVHALIRTTMVGVGANNGGLGSSSSSSASLSFSSRLSDAFATNTVLFTPPPGSSPAVSTAPTSSWLPHSSAEPATSGPAVRSSPSFSSAPASTVAALSRPPFTSTPASLGGPSTAATAASMPAVFLPAAPSPPPVASPTRSPPPATTQSSRASADLSASSSHTSTAAPFSAASATTPTHPNPLIAQWHDYYNDYYRQFYTTQLQALLAARQAVATNAAAAMATGATAHPVTASASTLRHRAAPGDAPTATAPLPPGPTATRAATPGAPPQPNLLARVLILITHSLVPPPAPRPNTPPVDPLVHARAVARNVMYAIIKWAFVRQLFGRSATPAVQPYVDLLMVVGILASAGVVDVAGMWRRVAASLVASGMPAAAPPDPVAAAAGDGRAQDQPGPGPADPAAPAAAADRQVPQHQGQAAVNGGSGALAVLASFFVSMIPGSHPLDPATTAAEHLRAMDAFEEQEAGAAAAAAVAR